MSRLVQTALGLLMGALEAAERQANLAGSITFPSGTTVAPDDFAGEF